MAEKSKDLAQSWFKCKSCGNLVYQREFNESLNICPSCQFHYPLEPQQWIDIVCDENSFEEIDKGISPVDVLNFHEPVNYEEKLKSLQKKLNQKDAVVTGLGEINYQPVFIGITDSRFLMGSMGSVVGEKLSRLFEYGKRDRVPVITITSSGGGARMHEGTVSLMQMVKTTQAVNMYKESGGLYISVLANPTMAGVMASFAALGDIIIAEPKALVGFTGPRVIQQTIKQTLPDDFQTSEFMLKHGFIDQIVERREMKSILAKHIDYFWL